MRNEDGRILAVTFLPVNRTVQAQRGDTLLDAALDNGIAMPHTCGGNCVCTICHVHIVAGMENLSPMEEPENERLDTADDRRPNSRLGCQALLRGGPVTARIVAWSVQEDRRFSDGVDG